MSQKPQVIYLFDESQEQTAEASLAVPIAPVLVSVSPRKGTSDVEQVSEKPNNDFELIGSRQIKRRIRQRKQSVKEKKETPGEDVRNRNRSLQLPAVFQMEDHEHHINEETQQDQPISQKKDKNIRQEEQPIMIVISAPQEIKSVNAQQTTKTQLIHEQKSSSPESIRKQSIQHDSLSECGSIGFDNPKDFHPLPSPMSPQLPRNKEQMFEAPKAWRSTKEIKAPSSHVQEDPQKAEGEVQSDVEDDEYLDQFDQIPVPSNSSRCGQSSIIKLNEIPLYTENYEAALHHPVPRGKTLSCWLIEHRQGILQLGKTFRLEGEGRLIIAAKKKTVKACSQYMVSTKPEVIQGDANYIGCLQSNFIGTEWNLFDAQTVRNNLLYLKYEFNLFGLNGPRKMQLAIPEIRNSRSQAVKTDQSPHPLKHGSPSLQLVNKMPTFSEKHKVFILDFKGKVKEPSVKNFILVDKQTGRECLLFGKHTQEKYIMQVGYPLSLFQAMAICLSSINRKLMVQ